MSDDITNPKNIDFELLVNELVKKLQVEKESVIQIYLYGSFAKDGEVTPSSDIDIIIVTKSDYEIFYDGLNPETINVQSTSGTDYGERMVDLTEATRPYEPVQEDTLIYSNGEIPDY